MTKKLVRDDDQAKETPAPAAGGADCEPDGPALERPTGRAWKRGLTKLTGTVRLRDGRDCKTLRRACSGVG